MIDVDAAGFEIRFPNTGLDEVDINSVFLYDAAQWVNGCLAEKFTVPFSDNNATARTLAYQKAWHLIRLSSIRGDDSDEIGDALDAMITALLDGTKAMIADDGIVLRPAEQVAQPGEGVWSNTMTYKPTLDEDAESFQVVDSDKIRDLRGDRR